MERAQLRWSQRLRHPERERRPRLGVAERRLLVLLGLPTFGLSLAYTVVGTYLPVLLSELSGPAVTGLLIGAEGLVALVVPLFVGGWSDATEGRYGRRLPFVVAGAALMIPALVLMSLSATLWTIAATLLLFFVAYFVYYTPYYALYPDLVPPDARARSQGVQGAFRSAGLLVALAGGGWLLNAWRPLPFLVSAVAVAVVTVALALGLRGRLDTGRRTRTRAAASPLRADWQLIREQPGVGAWVAANALWEGAVAALKTFVVLYFTVGLGTSLSGASLALALVGGAALVAAPLAGILGDRRGHQPVMRAACWVFALGLTPALLTTDTTFVLAVIPVAFAAVVLLTLPYALLMDLLPDHDQHGAGASLFGVSRGIGVLTGPLLAGVAIQVTSGWEVGAFAATSGYAAAFAVAGLFLLASIPLLGRIRG